MTTRNHHRRALGRAWRVGVAGILLLGTLSAPCGAATPRFSQPEFEGGHVIPALSIPPLPAGVARQYLDVGLMALALGIGVWLVHRRRSRAGIFVLMLSCLVYFGFVREGCICPVGSLQNVAFGLFDATYRVPLYVLLLFLLPLVVALFFGRVFCGAICPLGAIQDLMVIGEPKPLPRWLDAGLSLVRYLYLGLAVLLAALGAGFLICQHDPFVGFFRLSGPPSMFIAGGIVLALGVFVARPYCRFLCPYGVLLEWAARFARRPVAITPNECVTCRLCAESCPFDAIEAPSEGRPPDGQARGRRLLSQRLLVTPLILALGVALGYAAAPGLATLHPRVQLAADVQARQADERVSASEVALAFDENGGDAPALFAEANAIVRRFRVGASLLGLFLGLAASIRLLRLATYRTRTVLEPDSGRCLACTRCYGYCPVGRKRGRRT